MKRILLLAVCCIALLGFAGTAMAYNFGQAPTSQTDLENAFNVAFTDMNFGKTNQGYAYMGSQIVLNSMTAPTSIGKIDFTAPATVSGLNIVFYNLSYVDVKVIGKDGSSASLTLSMKLESTDSAIGIIGNDKDFETLLLQFSGISSLEFFASKNYMGSLPMGSSFALMGFNNYQPNAVPVPAAVWLLGSGLAGLVAIRRKNG